jgi:hypothetical protein
MTIKKIIVSIGLVGIAALVALTTFIAGNEASGEFKDVNGWSREINIARGAPGESSYRLTLDGATVVVLVNQLPSRRTVSVRFLDGRVTPLLDLQTDYVLMDKSSYDSAFSTALP